VHDRTVMGMHACGPVASCQKACACVHARTHARAHLCGHPTCTQAPSQRLSIDTGAVVTPSAPSSVGQPPIRGPSLKANPSAAVAAAAASLQQRPICGQQEVRGCSCGRAVARWLEQEMQGLDGCDGAAADADAYAAGSDGHCRRRRCRRCCSAACVDGRVLKALAKHHMPPILCAPGVFDSGGPIHDGRGF